MSKQKITSIQKQKLLDLLTNKPQLRAGKFTATFTHKNAQRQWEEVAEILNSVPGAKKDWKAWRKTWQDYLSKTKAKSASIRKIRGGTGGGPAPLDSLDHFEEGVAALLHPHAVSGHSQSTESAVIFDFDVVVPPSEEVPSIEPQNFPIIDDVILPPPHEYIDGNEARDDVQTATNMQPPQSALTGTQPPQTNNKQKKKKVNLKTLLQEKVNIKKDMCEAKKKWYNAYIINMERQTRALEEISRAINNINNNTSSSQSQHNSQSSSGHSVSTEEHNPHSQCDS